MDLTAIEFFRSVPDWFWWAFFFIYGAIIGSFLNVCIYRIPRDLEVVRMPSHCPHCGEKVSWYLNIPIVSWLILRGRTSCCSNSLTFRYPLVEFLYAVVSLAAYLQFGLSWHYLWALLFGGISIILIFIDWEHMRLPNVLTLPGAVLGLLFSVLGIGPHWINALLAALFGAASFWLIAVFYQKVRGMEGLGMGDVKLMLMIGVFLGLPLTLFVIVLGSLAALIYGVIRMKATKSDMTLKIPFGSFLSGAALVLFFWGKPLAEWYLGLFNP